ncbi:hypothetical protein L198_02847 [Cryptococcus wingfieldii CBS 7118]|uniref:Uncharacterized protein n=1 Tax=Cryptococcus wingfieldii CBS 7118 TaxID=1295528 RepID=A0A1E3JI53_9TREE|nr:hypothetical protein L198_02847 [Cryptococcus wingfieldii CBS 7118]ODO00528.1 hypothetical protein L198_02847 [Cryptococcus wingfieldii CBS 7118]
MSPWNAPRAKLRCVPQVQLKLSIQRLRTLQQKKHALAKASRRSIADLLAQGRVETCRLRVEGLIQDDIGVEVLEVLELYCEKLQARFNMLDASTQYSGTEPDASISDAVCAIVYAAPRTELKELQVLRDILMHKFGRPFALSLLPTEPPPDTVPARLTSKLALYQPTPELVDLYLWEIAKGYKVEWVPESVASETAAAAAGEEDEDEDEGGEEDEDEDEGGEAEGEDGEDGDKGEGKEGGKEGGEQKESTKGKEAEGVKEKKLSPEEELAARFAQLKKV